MKSQLYKNEAEFWKEIFWYPVVTAAGLLGAGAAAWMILFIIVKYTF